MRPVRWLELTIEVFDPLAAERIADLVREETGAAATEEPLLPTAPDEPPRRDPAAPLRVLAYLPAGADQRARALTDALDSLGLAARCSLRERDDAEWRDRWKEFFPVVHAGRVAVRPPWLTYDPRPGEVVVTIDPGLAFGTGQHETTALCLELLDRLPVAGVTVVDLGAGSGILAITASLLGAARALALDIEPAAVAAARGNARANDVAGRIDIAEGSLGDRWPFGETPERLADLALANINARTVQAEAEKLFRLLRPGGRLIASGIIAEQSHAVGRALEAAGFALEERPQRGEWCALLARRPDES